MKTMIPIDPASARGVTGLGEEQVRDELSLHGEPLARPRDYIVEGNIPDGGRIPERQLSEMFGISRTPLREALKVLAAEGLVDLLPNRGARVRQLSEQAPPLPARLRKYYGPRDRRYRTPALRNVRFLPASRHARLFSGQPTNPPE